MVAAVKGYHRPAVVEGFGMQAGDIFGLMFVLLRAVWPVAAFVIAVSAFFAVVAAIRAGGSD